MTSLSQMPLRPRHWYIFAVASLEQLIGAALSTIVGIIIPLIVLLGSPKLSALDQGILGASALVGIAIGSVVIGNLMDRLGYLFLFRLCPLIIAAGSVGVYFSDDIWAISSFLFSIGIGVGGGYSLDSGYISELLPAKWESFFVGLAKATCALGFVGGAAVSYLIIKIYPVPAIWPDLMFFIGFMGILAFILRLHWYQSPDWLLSRGKNADAQKAAQEFLGPDAGVSPLPAKDKAATVPWTSLFKGQGLDKVILSGITWACEGLGVYGFGVFLPILVMALGMDSADASGIPKVLDSVKITIFINIFIGAGFAIGLAILHKMNILKLMGWGFILCGLALIVLLAAYEMKLPVWISFLSFIVFETALNAGPHLVTYIVPAQIYDVRERGIGTGIATLFGKVGAIAGVFFVPFLLHVGGVGAVLWLSVIVQFIGAAITFIYGKKLKLL